MPEIFFRNNIVYVELVNTVNFFAVLDQHSYNKIISHKIAGRERFNILYNLRKHNPRNFPYWQQKVLTKSEKKSEVFTIYLHALVAELFLPQYTNETWIGNKNGIPIDCRSLNIVAAKDKQRTPRLAVDEFKNPLLLFLAHAPEKPKLQVNLHLGKTELINVDTGKVIWTTTNFTSPEIQNNRIVKILVTANCQLEPVVFVVSNGTQHIEGNSVFDILPFRTIKNEAPTF